MVFVSELVSSIIIAIVQGLTEWIPVSSSGHLVLFEKILSFEGGLVFDVALHFGTLMAVFVYFGSDIIDIVRDLLSGKWGGENGRLGLLVIVATIPAALMGYFFQSVFEVAFFSLNIVAMGFAVTGVFLLIASLGHINANPSTKDGITPIHPRPRGVSDANRFFRERGGKRFGYLGALLVGLAQVFALFPGVSRSGATIGSGLLLGLKEKEALKFSFLMSIPIIFGANILTIGNNTLPPSLIWATLVSFVVGLGTIHLLYKKILVDRKNLRWFGIYALALAIILGGAIVFAGY